MFAVQSSIRGYGAKQIKKNGAQTSTPRPKQSMSDVVTKRMLSARRLKINELKVCHFGDYHCCHCLMDIANTFCTFKLE